MVYAVYDVDSGEIKQSLDVPDFMKDMVELNHGESIVEIPRLAHDATEYIKHGKLTLKPIADNSPD